MCKVMIVARSKKVKPKLPSHIPFSVVVKPTGAGCNLNCEYCFFLSKEILYNTKQQMMTLDTIKSYLRNLLEASPNGQVTIPWQGGEPIMRGIDFFRQAVKWAKDFARPEQEVKHAIQTNGTLINTEWAKFLRENDFLVGISIDGPKEIHDIYRVNRAGRPTYSQVKRGWELLVEHGVSTNVLCTVHAGNQHYPLEVYQHFRDELGARFIQFIPIVERVEESDLALAEAGWNIKETTQQRLLYRQRGTAVTSRSVSPKAWGDFLTQIFDEWVRHDVGKMYVQHFDTALAAVFGMYELCVHAPQCGTALAVEYNGDVYACDHYVEPGYRLGNATSNKSLVEMVLSASQRQFGRQKANLSQYCQQCEVRKYCHGGCPKDRFLGGEIAQEIAGAQVELGEAPLNYLCAGYRRFFSHIDIPLQRMAYFLRTGRPAREIMQEMNK